MAKTILYISPESLEMIIDSLKQDLREAIRIRNSVDTLVKSLTEKEYMSGETAEEYITMNEQVITPSLESAERCIDTIIKSIQQLEKDYFDIDAQLASQIRGV